MKFKNIFVQELNQKIIGYIIIRKQITSLLTIRKLSSIYDDYSGHTYEYWSKEGSISKIWFQETTCLSIGMVSLKDERIVYSRVIEYIPTYLGHVVKSRQL